MAIDPNIFAQFAPKPINALDVENALMRREVLGQNMLQGQLENQLSRAKLAAEAAAQGRQQDVRNALLALQPGATDQDRVAALKGTGHQEGFKLADELELSLQRRDKSKADIQQTQAQTASINLKNATDRLGLATRRLAALDPNDDEAIVNAFDANVREGLYGDDKKQATEMAVDLIERMPKKDTPERLRWFVRQLDTGLTRKEQIDADLARLREAEAKRHNLESEVTARGNLGVAQGRLKLDRDRYNREGEEPKGVITQTDAGPVLVNPRDGTATPVTVNGQPAQKPLKALPTAVNTAFIENAQTLASLQKALDLLDGKSVNGVRGDPAATGWKGFLPEPLLNRIDPSGVDTRAEIADIGSLKIHDRSGANVTVSESPRLMPFIPTATDSRDAARKKLQRLFNSAKAEQEALGATYSADAGYRPNPIASRPSSGSASGWKIERIK